MPAICSICESNFSTDMHILFDFYLFLTVKQNTHLLCTKCLIYVTDIKA